MTAGSVSLRFFKSCILTLVQKNTSELVTQKTKRHKCNTSAQLKNRMRLSHHTPAMQSWQFSTYKSVSKTFRTATFQLPTSKKLDEPSPSSVCRSTSVCNTRSDLSCLFPCSTQSDSFNDYSMICHFRTLGVRWYYMQLSHTRGMFSVPSVAFPREETW